MTASLPECMLVLETHGRLDAARDLGRGVIEALAAAAPWSKEAGRELEKLLARLQSRSADEIPEARPATRKQLVALLGSLGIQSAN